MHQHRTPAFATDHESEREGVVDRIAELLNFAIILPPRNITTFDGFCSAIALLNPFLVMCQGILFELYNARLGNRALVLGKEPEERGESPATKGDTRAMFFRVSFSST